MSLASGKIVNRYGFRKIHLIRSALIALPNVGTTQIYTGKPSGGGEEGLPLPRSALFLLTPSSYSFGCGAVKNFS
jgi:hypothetical protein